MVKKDSISLDQNIDSTPTYTKPNQAYLSSANGTTTSPINFSATNNIPFPGQKQPLQINTLKRKPSETNLVSVILSPTNISKPQSVNVAYRQGYLQQQQEGIGSGMYSPINMKSNERLGYGQGFDQGNNSNNINLNNTNNNNNSRIKTINTSNNNNNINNRSVNHPQHQNYQQPISSFTLGQQQQQVFSNNNPNINPKPLSSTTSYNNNNNRSQFQTSLDYGSGSRVNYYNNNSSNSGLLGTTNNAATTAGNYVNNNNNSNSKTFQYSYKTDPKLKDSIK